MNQVTYARRNLFRRPGRAVLTVLAVMVTVLVFCVIRTFVASFTAGTDSSGDRLATRHKVSITMNFPRHYIDELRSVPGVKVATWANWFGAKDPKERVPFFAGIAVDQDSYLDVQDDFTITADELKKWKATPNGAVLGDLLAKKFNVKIGDKVTITSDIYPGDWEFEVVAIYKPARAAVDRSTFLFRWDYLNNDPRSAFSRDKLGWMMSRVTDSTKGAEVSSAIDAKFDGFDDQTSTMTERAFQLSFLGGFTAVLRAMDYASLVILLIMTLILANTIAMGVRERNHEYGVLRAIGFEPRHIVRFVIAESALLAALGGLLAIGLDILVVNNGLGPVMEEGGFRVFRTPGSTMLIALGAAIALGLIAGALPAWSASRLKVTDALRRLN